MKTITIDRAVLEQVLDALKRNHYAMIEAGMLDQSVLNQTFTAHQCLHDSMRQALEQPAEPQLKKIHPLDIPLDVFVADLSTRLRNVINAEMAYFVHFSDECIKPPFTVRHLMMFSRKELRKWPNLGKRSLNEIEEQLRNIGLQLWEDHDERSLRLLREHRLYTCTQQAAQWVGLTDEEIQKLAHVYDNTAPWTLMGFARAIEAKLKEKNT